MGRRGPTLQEIAREAGVSIATVSRVARGIGQVAPQTRHRVLEAIERRQFRPSHLGRALVERRHAALGVVFPGLAGPYYPEVIAGFEDEVVRARLGVVILGTHLRNDSIDLVLDLADRVDGMAVMGGVLPDNHVLRLVERGSRVILLAGKPLSGVPTIRTENRAAMCRLTTHLLTDHGYRELAFVGDPEGSPDVTFRWRGFLDAHEQVGVRPPERPIRVGMRQDQGVVAGRRLLDARARPRAVVCANDETALGVVLAAMDRGLRVPHDIAVTGFDDSAMAGLVASGLTTVRQPMRQLGSETARLLLRQVDNGTELELDTVLDTEIVVRGSCGCADQTADQTADQMSNPTESRSK